MSNISKFRVQRDTADSLEIDRIVALPISETVDDAVVEAFCKQEVRPEYYDQGFRLFPSQVGAVLAYDIHGGAFLPIGVGWGKTLISLMIANRAWKRGESKRSMLVVPSQVYTQLIKTDIPQARKWVGLDVPFHYLGGRDAKTRRRMASSSLEGCYIMPYSLLSTKDAEDTLQAIGADLLILDEAHNVKNPKAARTTRLRRYMTAAQPALVALSGTITSKSIRDYHHLISVALKRTCPLPLSDSLATNWSYVLDPEKIGMGQGESGKHGKTGPLMPLVNWARQNFPMEEIPVGVPGFRKAYKLRLTHSPGVVSTGDAQIGTSLTIRNEPVEGFQEHPDFPTLKGLMRRVDEEWITPSGDEIEHGFHKWRFLNELTAGFYYKLRWPTLEELGNKGLDEATATDYLKRAKKHHEARQEYSSNLRRWIQYRGRPGLDTPLLVANNMSNHGARDVGKQLFELYTEMKSLVFEGMPERISEPIRICDYKIQASVEWAKQLAKKKRGGIIWYHHNEVGKWLVEELKAAGLDALWCPSEAQRKGSNERILDKANGNKILVASMGGHGTGKNLQHLEFQRFHQFPRQASLLEQVLGRLHRNGQLADELIPVTTNTTEFDHQNMYACLIDALYIAQTTGVRQKAVYASYDPLPKQYPWDFLRERGTFGNVDSEAQRKLDEKFGS